MPANTGIIPLKAIRTGDQATGDVTALGELTSGDKISISYINTATLSTNAVFQAALANTNSYIATKEDTGTSVALAIALG